MAKKKKAAAVAVSPKSKLSVQDRELIKAAKKAEAELRKQYADVVSPKPHLMTRIFRLPGGTVESVAMRELDGEDDILSSFWADKHATEAVKQSKNAAWIADQREGIRISLVAVEGTMVNQDGVPFMDCDNWTSKTWRILAQCFSEMNGVPEADLKNAVWGSLVLGGGSAPIESMESEETAPEDE